ncbi:hypothetical protein GLOIN_2v1783661 [Rhizophagus irregularis DAOM 181602=DAOM 197198]|nr:hypothetical protein GLOIN_2v1783661 [Rhizophagus irregularis DAOM 181602=DAOM 197198]
MTTWLEDVALAVFSIVGTLSFFSPTTKNWIVSLDDFGSPIFGKQLLVQAGRGTCFIVHWISSNCESSPGELIKLSSCPEDGVRLYYSRLDFASDSPPADTTVASATPITVESSAAAVFANSPLVASVESRYIFFTDGSLINLDYVVDWDLTWFALKFEPSHDASFTFDHASRH